MRGLLFVGAAFLAATLPAAAFTRQQTQELAKLSGATRLIQACDLEALIRIAADRNGLRPSHAPVDALSPPQIKGNTLKGDGGAVRSRDKWYQFSFTCVTSPDHLKVTSFTYKIGQPIPKEQWAAANLYE